MISLDDLITKVSPDDYMARLESVLSTLGTDPSKFRKGGVLRVLMRAQGMTFSGLTEIMVAVIRGGFLDLAEGAWLTLLARYVFGVERRAEQPASGNVTLVNGGGGTFAPGDYPIGSVRLYSSRTGKKYLNAEPLSLGPFATVTIAVVAVETGAASNAAAGDIDSLETSLLGVTAANAEAVVGLDEESDVDLRTACRAKTASVSDLGPRGAYLWAVRQATRLDGTPTAINRVFVPEGTWDAVVRVVLASAAGAPIAGDLTAATTSIESRSRPSGIKVEVQAAAAVPYARTATIWVQRTSGLDLYALQAQANQAIATGLSTYPIGGFKKPSQTQGALYSDWIKGACKVHPSVFDVDLSLESDLLLASNEVVTWAGSVLVRAA
ncbi:MAG: hypothetical protein JWP97_5773 [Labilithrix sp.]|nr:hypothetical protein [Labilithrix sp.]